jgi:hypothetical protein
MGRSRRCVQALERRAAGRSHKRNRVGDTETAAGRVAGRKCAETHDEWIWTITSMDAVRQMGSIWIVMVGQAFTDEPYHRGVSAAILVDGPGLTTLEGDRAGTRRVPGTVDPGHGDRVSSDLQRPTLGGGLRLREGGGYSPALRRVSARAERSALGRA